MKKSKIDDFEMFEPRDRPDWRRWLAENYDRSDGIWLVYYKKGSGVRNVVYDEAVEEALCYGWIDSLPRKLDENRSMLMFTPRKATSVWSKINKERIEKLIEAGSMAEPGMEKIAVAKQNGQWNALDDSDLLNIPGDLDLALKSNADSKKNFDSFSDSVRRNILSWISMAKREETRQKRIAETVSLAKIGRVAGPYGGKKG